MLAASGTSRMRVEDEPPLRFKLATLNIPEPPKANVLPETLSVNILAPNALLKTTLATLTVMPLNPVPFGWVKD